MPSNFLTAAVWDQIISRAGLAKESTLEEIKSSSARLSAVQTALEAIQKSYAAGLALASGAATSSNQVIANAKQVLELAQLTALAAKDFATQATLASVLAKLSADPATQTTLAALLAKVIATPATESKQDTGNASLTALVSGGSSSFVNLTAAATTVVKSGAGTLRRIIFNQAVSLGVLTLYDNTSAAGTKIATITFPVTLLASQAVINYGIAFSTGLTVVKAGLDDITVVYN